MVALVLDLLTVGGLLRGKQTGPLAAGMPQGRGSARLGFGRQSLICKRAWELLLAEKDKTEQEQ